MPDLNLEMRGAGPRRPGSSRRRKDGGPSKRDTAPRRTTLHEDGLHVATIVEYVDDTMRGLGFCIWYTAGNSDHSPNFAAAIDAVHTDLLR